MVRRTGGRVTHYVRERRSGRRSFAVLPLIAALAVVAVGAVTAGSAYLSLASAATGPSGAPSLASTSLADPNHGVTLNPTWTTAAVLLGGYLVACFTGTLFSAALVATADDRRRHGRGHSAEGMHVAMGHAPQLAVWSLIAGTVGVVARQCGHRGIIGLPLGRPTRRDWNEATALVLPLIVNEGLGPFAAWRRSRRLTPEVDQTIAPTRGATAVPLSLGVALLAGAATWPVAPVAALLAMTGVALLAYVGRATATGTARSAAYHRALLVERAEETTAGTTTDAALATALTTAALAA